MECRLASAMLLFLAGSMSAQPAGRTRAAGVEARIERVMPEVVAWRRDIHQHPELSNREFRTARLVAEQLTRLGLEVRTGVARTGVVALLRGGKPGPVVALRADLDALPVTEQVDLPFKSTATTEFNGQQVGVMHACGHDNHVAILLGAATVLAGMAANSIASSTTSDAHVCPTSCTVPGTPAAVTSACTAARVASAACCFSASLSTSKAVCTS